MENDEAKLYRHFIKRMLMKFLFNIVLRQAFLKQTVFFSVCSVSVFLTNKMHIKCKMFKITDAIAIKINAPSMLFDISYLSIILLRICRIINWLIKWLIERLWKRIDWNRCGDGWRRLHRVLWITNIWKYTRLRSIRTRYLLPFPSKRENTLWK